jgi:hypothetical protein
MIDGVQQRLRRYQPDLMPHIVFPQPKYVVPRTWAEDDLREDVRAWCEHHIQDRWRFQVAIRLLDCTHGAAVCRSVPLVEFASESDARRFRLEWGFTGEAEAIWPLALTSRRAAS